MFEICVATGKKKNPSLHLNNEIELIMGPSSILSNSQAMPLIHC